MFQKKKFYHHMFCIKNLSIKKRDLPNCEQVPFFNLRVIFTPQLLPARRLTGTDYQHFTANLGNIWETL